MDKQLLHQVWLNDLDTAQHGVGLWETLMNAIHEELDPAPGVHHAVWQREMNRVYYFKHLINQLANEILTHEKRTANEQDTHELNRGIRLNEQSLNEKMDSFHANFRAFKVEIRRYVAAQHLF